MPIHGRYALPWLRFRRKKGLMRARRQVRGCTRHHTHAQDTTSKFCASRTGMSFSNMVEAIYRSIEAGTRTLGAGNCPDGTAGPMSSRNEWAS